MLAAYQPVLLFGVSNNSFSYVILLVMYDQSCTTIILKFIIRLFRPLDDCELVSLQEFCDHHDLVAGGPVLHEEGGERGPHRKKHLLEQLQVLLLSHSHLWGRKKRSSPTRPQQVVPGLLSTIILDK